jgi:hypothetical protein
MAAIPEQNNYVKKCLDDKLAALLDHKIDDAITINNPTEGILALIDPAFMGRYPILPRRLQWGSCKMTAGETPDLFMARYDAVKREADITTMTSDDLAMHGYLGGLGEKSPQLKLKLMDLKDPTYEMFGKKVTQWMSTRRNLTTYKETEGAPAAQVNYVKSQQKVTVPASIKLTPDILRQQGKCFTCGSTAHTGKNCDKKETNPACGKCKKTGHLQAVCLSEYMAWRRKTTSGQGGKGGHGANARQVSAGSNDDEEQQVATSP